MKKREKFADAILDIAEIGHSVGLLNGKPFDCECIKDCDNCGFPKSDCDEPYGYRSEDGAVVDIGEQILVVLDYGHIGFLEKAKRGIMHYMVNCKAWARIPAVFVNGKKVGKAEELKIVLKGE